MIDGFRTCSTAMALNDLVKGHAVPVVQCLYAQLSANFLKTGPPISGYRPMLPRST